MQPYRFTASLFSLTLSVYFCLTSHRAICTINVFSDYPINTTFIYKSQTRHVSAANYGHHKAILQPYEK